MYKKSMLVFFIEPQTKRNNEGTEVPAEKLYTKPTYEMLKKRSITSASYKTCFDIKNVFELWKTIHKPFLP